MDIRGRGEQGAGREIKNQSVKCKNTMEKSKMDSVPALNDRCEIDSIRCQISRLRPHAF